jgi:hypothetical protein
MIGKLDMDQRSGVRDQKRNNLGARWRAFEAAEGLTEKDRGQGSGIRGERPVCPQVSKNTYTSAVNASRISRPKSSLHAITYLCF